MYPAPTFVLSRSGDGFVYGAPGPDDTPLLGINSCMIASFVPLFRPVGRAHVEQDAVMMAAFPES